jgi:hypothetical protein
MRCFVADMSCALLPKERRNSPVSPFLLRSVGVEGPPRLPFGLVISCDIAKKHNTHLARLDISFETFFPLAGALITLPVEGPATGVAALASKALLLRLYRPSATVEMRDRLSGGETAAGGGVGDRGARLLPLRSNDSRGGESRDLLVSKFSDVSFMSQEGRHIGDRCQNFHAVNQSLARLTHLFDVVGVCSSLAERVLRLPLIVPSGAVESSEELPAVALNEILAERRAGRAVTLGVEEDAGTPDARTSLFFRLVVFKSRD